MSAVAFSYIRFSSPEQAKGDSLRRQMAGPKEWSARHKVPLDTSMTLHDKGISGYTGEHRNNPDRHALAAFLRAVELGRVPSGSFLLIENLDRLSREHIQPALRLVFDLLAKGIKIVQLSPVEMTYSDQSGPTEVMMMILELSRGHSESKIKSERVGQAWKQKKVKARAGVPVSKRLPSWVQMTDGRLVLDPVKAVAVRRVFELCIAGYGSAGIVRKLTADGVPAIGDSGKWVRSYVSLLLNDRRAVGEYQPCNRDGSPDGAAIPDYFPPVVTEDVFFKARGATTGRHGKQGRVGKNVNIFAGLVTNARDGDSYYLCTRTEQRRGKKVVSHVLLNTDAAEGRSKAYSFPFEVFEDAILTHLREIDPREIIGDGDGSGSEILGLTGQLAAVEADVNSLTADLHEHGVSPVVLKLLRSKEEERERVVTMLNVARQKAAHPLAEAWGEAKTLADVLKTSADPEDTRMRLRSVLRRVVRKIVLLVSSEGMRRYALAEVHFHEGEKRILGIEHRPAHHGFGGAKTKPKRLDISWRPSELQGYFGADTLEDPERAAQIAAVHVEVWKGFSKMVVEAAWPEGAPV